MKEAEKIIDHSKYWLNEDQKNRAAVVALVDGKENRARFHFYGTTREIGQIIYTLMTKNKDLGHDIYVSACLYAHRHITAEERDKINAVISAVAEERKKIEAFISAHKKAERRREMKYRIRPRIYACFTHSNRQLTLQSSLATYAVQVRKWYGWVTVKNYNEGFNSDFAFRQAEELLEFLNQ